MGTGLSEGMTRQEAVEVARVLTGLGLTVTSVNLHDRTITVHVPPRVPGYGLTAQELHDYQRTFTEYAAARLLTVGADQYDEGESQKFEDMDLIKLATGLREELADVVNYAVMLDIRLTRIADRWDTLRKVSGHGVSE